WVWWLVGRGLGRVCFAGRGGWGRVMWGVVVGGGG
ncbi:hypothetical protein E3A20_13240, partial [Planctomyces bekefii]